MDELFKKLVKAQELSYSPYSHFRVSAIIRLKNGEEIVGANIENAAYGECICAERTALFQMKLKKVEKKDVEFIAILGDTSDYISPCGACRQVMSELLDLKTKVYLFSNNGKYKILTVEELIPLSFSSSMM